MVSVMITTKNRAADLRRTLGVIRRLEPPADEILITADGCTDHTLEVVKAEAPDAIVVANDPGLGSVASRAAMMEMARGEFVFALDDDSYPEQLDCLAMVRLLFSADDKLAVATFPQRSDEYPETLQQKEFGQRRKVRSFPNSGACLRVSAYRALAGFEPMFFHMYEEPDYSLQCVASGWNVLLVPDITIRHHWTPNERSEIRNHQRHARNEFWSTLMRCPFPHVVGVAAFRVFAQARYAARRGLGWLVREPAWWWQALLGVPQALQRRRAVSWRGYRDWLRLPDQ